MKNKENFRSPGMEELQEKKKHGDFAFPMNVYWNDFTTYIEESIPWHWHEELEFVVVTKGSVEVSAGSGNFILEEGKGLFINSNTLHSMKPAGEEKAYMFSIVANASILGAEKGFLLSTKYVNPFITGDAARYRVLEGTADWQETAVSKLKEIFEVFMKKDYAYEYELHNLLCHVWYLLLQNSFRGQQEKIVYKEEDENRIYLAMEYIQNHYHEVISLDDICEEIHISKSECCRCFKRALKLTPFEYLMRYRITIAARLLEEGNKPITDIAVNTGFNSTSYFGKVFRGYMNCSPKEYRRSKRRRQEGE